MNSNTLASIKPTPRTPQPRVQVRAFNSQLGQAWKRESLAWLNALREKRFGLVEGHTLELRVGHLSREFVVLVVEKALGPIRPLPTKVRFDHQELGAPSGHDIHIDLNESPPEVKTHRHFWECSLGKGKTPHFKSHVLPLIDELISSFKGGRAAWVD